MDSFQVSSVLMVVYNDFKSDNRVRRAAKAMKEVTSNLTLLAYHSNNLNESEVLDNGYKLTRLKLKKFSLFPKQIANFLKYLDFKYKAKKIADLLKPSVVHCHDYNTLFLGIYCKKKFGSKLIYDNHEYFQDLNYIHRYPLFIRKRIAEFEKRTLQRFVDKLVVVSSGIADLYAKLYKGQIRVIRNIPEVPNKDESDDLPREVQEYLDEQENENRKILLYLGTNAQRGRGLNFAVNLLNELPLNYSIVIFGAKSEKEVTVLEEKYISYYQQNKFKVFKSVNHSQLIKIAKYCSFGLSLIEPIYLSYKYCLPNKLFEYMIMDLPVIASDLPDQKKLIEQYNLGVVVPFNIEIAKEKILSYVPNKIDINNSKCILNWENESKIYHQLLT